MKVSEALKLLRKDGWYRVPSRGGHRQFSAVCSRVAYGDQERPWRSYLLPAGEGAPQGRMRDEMLALARKFPSSGRSGPTPQAGFPPLPAGEGEDVPPRLQLNGKTRYASSILNRDPAARDLFEKLPGVFWFDPFRNLATSP